MGIKSLQTIAVLLWSEGIWMAMRSVKNNLEEKFFELKYGISTAEIKTTQQLGVTLPEARCYVATSYSYFNRLIKALRIHAGKDVFVDFGSGMGRSLVLAALHPFKKVIGVEISQELCAIAQANLGRAKEKLRCKDVTIVASDARSFMIPPDMTVAYFFNPFTGSILQTVLEHIHESLVQTPRQLHVVCNNYSLDSEFALQMRRCAWLKTLRTIPLGVQGHTGIIYVNA